MCKWRLAPAQAHVRRASRARGAWRAKNAFSLAPEPAAYVQTQTADVEHSGTITKDEVLPAIATWRDLAQSKPELHAKKKKGCACM